MKLCPKCQKHFSDDANFCPVDAARLVPLEGKADADSLAAKFELGDRLGGSRTGAVHRATDKATKKAVAVKIVAKDVMALPGVAQRLERELKQLERVQSVGVCKVLASGRRGDEVWVATELLDGAMTLAESISAQGPIPIDQAAHLVEVIGEALIEAAQVGVVHRDLAPKNVLFAGDEIKLINFSLPVPSPKVAGVLEFVAPEQVDGRAVDQRSNLYSLGALYYYVLTGQPVASDNGAVKPPSALGVQVPAPVEAVILRALDRSPTKRFLTVRQFVDEVTRVGKGEVIELKSPTMAMGRANKPKAELVSTLIGMRTKTPPFGAVMSAASSAAQTQVQAVASAPTAQGVAAVAVSAVPASTRQTALGVASAAQTAPQPTVAPAVAAAQPLEAPPMQVKTASPSPPVVAAPVVATAAAAAPQGKKKASDDPDTKGKFRETMWFKKGELDAQAAQKAAEERARTGKDAAPDKADSLPMDERYKDDGSITRGDKEKYSLRTGDTQAMKAMGEKPALSGKVSADELIGEMKGGRNVVFIGLGVAAVLIAVVVYLLTR